MSCYSRWSSRSIKSVNLGSPNSSFCFYRLLTATTQLSRTRLAFLVTKGMWLLKKKFHLPLNRFRGVARFLTTSACQRQKQALWEDDWSRPRGQHGPNITAIHPNIFRDYKKKSNSRWRYFAIKVWWNRQQWQHAADGFSLPVPVLLYFKFIWQSGTL